MNIELLNQASAFISQEADMLDHGEYAEWLALWEEKGLYIVPINPDETDFANTLNYACDDAKMRACAWPAWAAANPSPPRRRRAPSAACRASASWPTTAHRHRALRPEPARVPQGRAEALHRRPHLHLVRAGDSFRIQQKVVRLLNSTDALQCIGYIL
jgi:hypothetical protein